MESEDILTKRINNIKSWLKDPYNLALLSIIIFAIAIRLYYFWMTKNQPLWWDEAEYMNIARSWRFDWAYEFTPVRPVLFSFFAFLFMFITQGEILSRIFIFALSIVSVIGTYYLGKEIQDKKVGLFASFIMSLFYLNLFFTNRLIVDIPSLAFFVLSTLFFYKYLTKGNNNSLYLASILISVGTMFKQSTGFLLVVIFVYLLFTKGIKGLFKKEIMLSVLLFFLVISPYIIWGYFQFGGFILLQGASEVTPENHLVQGYQHFITYLSLFPIYFAWPILIFLIIGIIFMYKLFLGLDLLNKPDQHEIKRDFFLILSFIIPIILASFLINHTEDRYIINSMPIIFIIISIGVFRLKNILSKKSKFLSLLLILFMIGYIGYFQINSADSLIKNKMNSYSEIREAGYWFANNSIPTEVIMSTSIKQIPYYSWRKTLPFPFNESDFEELINKDPNIHFFMISGYESQPDWVYSYPQRKNLSIANAYFVGSNANPQPIVVIYYLNNSLRRI